MPNEDAENLILPVYHLDANRVNAKGRDAGVNQLERWHREGIIFLEFALEAYREAEYGDACRAWKAADYTWAETVDNLGDEQARLRQIADVVFLGGARNVSEQNDVRILYSAWKAGAVLISEDGNSKRQPRGILGSKDELAKIGIRVLSTSEAITEIAGRLKPSA